MDAEIPLFLVCLLMSAFFSGSETAMLSANRLKLRQDARDGDVGAQRILELVRDPRRLLAGILVGNNIFNVLAASAATSYGIRKFGGVGGLVLAPAVATVVLVVFSEFLPKTVAALHPIRWAVHAVNPIRAVLVLLTPLVYPLEAVTRPLARMLGSRSGSHGLAEVRAAILEGVRVGALDETMEQVLRGGLSLEWKTAAHVLIPRVDVVSVDVNAGFRDCRAIFRADGYSRLLVMDGTPDADLGYVAAKDLTLVDEEERSKWRVRDSVRDALRVPASLPLPKLLARMRQSGVHVAVVKDEYGGTNGIVTLEDVLEELVGEIRDEHDESEVPPVVRSRPNVWMVKGEVSLHDLADRLDLARPDAESLTVGGLVAETLGRLPQPGDVLDVEGMRMKVERVEDNRVLRVRVEKLPA